LISTIYELHSFVFSVLAPPQIHAQLSLFVKESYSSLPLLLFDIYDTNMGGCTKFDFVVDECIQYNLKGYNLYYRPSKNEYYQVGTSIYGIFNVEKGYSRIQIDSKKYNPRNLFHVCILDIMSLISVKYNSIIFHAASMVSRNKAYLFMGDSGNGKSTVTYRLSQKTSIAKASDDVAIFNLAYSGATIYPINSGYGYSKDIAYGILQNSDKCVKLYETDNKCYIYEPEVASATYLLGGVFFLKRIVSECAPQNTDIFLLEEREFLRRIIKTQTNVGSSLLKAKFRLYKTLSACCKGFDVTYVNDCDIRVFEEYLK